MNASSSSSDREAISGRFSLPSLSRDKEADMFTTVFIGNEETLVIQGKMVTPRGYGRERNRI